MSAQVGEWCSLWSLAHFKRAMMVVVQQRPWVQCGGPQHVHKHAHAHTHTHTHTNAHTRTHTRTHTHHTPFPWLLVAALATPCGCREPQSINQRQWWHSKHLTLKQSRADNQNTELFITRPILPSSNTYFFSSSLPATKKYPLLGVPSMKHASSAVLGGQRTATSSLLSLTSATLHMLMDPAGLRGPSSSGCVLNHLRNSPSPSSETQLATQRLRKSAAVGRAGEGL